MLGSDRWKHFATVTTGACTWSEIQTQDVINLGCVWNDIPGQAYSTNIPQASKEAIGPLEHGNELNLNVEKKDPLTGSD